MKSLIISETKRTPTVYFDYQKGRLDLSGYCSMPEVSDQFYQPILSWISQYIDRPVAAHTILSIRLEYFNTTTGKLFVEILKKLDILAQRGHPVILKWYYEEDDEDMCRSGDDMEASVRYVQIEKIPYTNT